jgi:hypothetical protein
MSVIESHGQLYPRGDAFEFHVHGVTLPNKNGLSRQNVILRLWVRDPLCLVREPDNPKDPNAIRVDARQGIVGYVPAAGAQALAARLDAGEIPNVFVQWLAGGTHNKPTRGVGIIVDFDTPPPPNTPAPSAPPTLGMLTWFRNLFQTGREGPF